MPCKRANCTESSVFASSEIRRKEDPTGMPGEYNEIMDVKRPRRTSARLRPVHLSHSKTGSPRPGLKLSGPSPATSPPSAQLSFQISFSGSSDPAPKASAERAAARRIEGTRARAGGGASAPSFSRGWSARLRCTSAASTAPAR